MKIEWEVRNGLWILRSSHFVVVLGRESLDDYGYILMPRLSDKEESKIYPEDSWGEVVGRHSGYETLEDAKLAASRALRIFESRFGDIEQTYDPNETLMTDLLTSSYKKEFGDWEY